jgi:drug/metabolite transporter (DMT)-like permease
MSGPSKASTQASARAEQGTVASSSQTGAPRRSTVRGIAIMLFAVATLSVMDAGMKLLAPHYPPMQVAALRGMASWPLIAAWVYLTVPLGSLLRVRWTLHLFRGAIAIGMLASFAYALRTLPLSTAYALFFVAPLLITALSVPILGERVGPRRWAAIAIGLVGVVVILRPSGDGMLSLPGLAVLAAAFGYAVSAVSVRVLGRTDSTQAMVFWLVTLLAVGAGLLAAPQWQPLLPTHVWIVAGIGLTGALGQWAVTEAFRAGEASAIAPFEYSALAWGAVLDLAFWGVLPGMMTWLGAGLIVVSGLYLAWRERVAAGVDDRSN